MKRRDFVKTVASPASSSPPATSIGDLLAQSPQGKRARVEVQGACRTSRSPKPRRAGCSYADIRFTRNIEQRRQRQRRQPGADAEGAGGFGGGGGGGGGRRRRRRRWWRRRAADGGGGVPTDAERRGGLRRARDSQRRLGLRQQPDRHRRRNPAHHAHGDRSRAASAIAKKTDVRLAPVPAYQAYWATPMAKDPTTMSRDRQAGAACRRSSTRPSRTRASRTSTSRSNTSYEWKYFASSEGSYIEQEICHDVADLHRHGAQGRRRTRTRNFRGIAEDRRLGSRRSGEDARERRAHRRPRRSSSCTAKPLDMGVEGSRS